MTAQAPSSANAGVNVVRHPREEHLTRGKPFQGDVRTLPQVPPTKFERPEFEEPEVTPVPYPGTAAVAQGGMATSAAAPNFNAPAPSPSSSFEGLDFANWGAGHPPDTNGDVGPQHYLQTINTSVGVYGKNGVRLAAFTFNTLMSQGSFGNLCDTNNFGDPVVLYDTFEDRWIITDFAFKLDGSGNIIAPAYQCLAVSKSGDPVAGGWNFYSISSTSGFGDYPKFGIWPDGLYMSANMFGFGAGGSFQNVRVWAFNKAQMYAGEPAVQVLSFDAPSAEFTLLPSNARLQTGTPPAGSPNYFAVVWQFLNAVSVYKFHVNWTSTSTSTFSGPFTSLTPTWWAQYLNSSATTVPSPANRLDSLYPRLMVQNQYTNLGGAESLWTSHTVGAGNPTSNVTSAQAAVRYYQVKVTGGNVEASATQSFTYSPDSTVFRFMPSVAVDRAGDMAIGYSASDAALNPAIRYAARLAGDPLNAITQTEQSLLEGTGSQSGSCGSTCVRWGDYSAMTLDVDGCTFWYTNLYYQTTGLSFNTRIGTFSLPGCTAVTTGSLQGTVTAAASGNPISGATVELGSRTATTDVNGNYDFTSLASGVYPSVASSSPGYNSMTAANIVVSDGGIATQNFSLTSALTSGCFTDTTQADFQAGVPTNCDLTNSPGDVILVNSANLDQQNTTLGNSGVGITTTTWGGQTFTPAVTGRLTRADINLFCSGCTGTTPDLTLSVRATSGGLPTGADLAAATITGFSNASAVLYTANFSSPATLTSGTQYALVIRPTANPSAGTYALTRSGTSTAGADVYAGGARVSGASSGTVWSIPPTGGVTTDAGFKTYMQTGFASSGTFVSSTKDANPAPGANVNWTTLSWTADTPANTAIQFQVASSNIADGPFNFVGPDGTTGTFFTNGGSLAQFAGQRYLKYQASLTTTSGAVTPTLHDVSVCFSDFGPTTLVVAEASGPFGGTADLFAILTSGGIFVSDKSMSFKLNGHTVGSALSDGSGNATVAAVSLAGITAGTYPGAVTAAFAGDSGFGASSGSGTLTVQKLAQTITFGALASKTFGNPDFGVSATASSGLTVTFAASGNCTVTGSTVHITGAGSCTITASQAGDSNYNPAADVPQSFSIQTPALPASGWRVLYVDSQATDCGNYGATNTFDGNNATMWLTEYCHGSPATPHEIQIDLGASYNIAGFQYLPRQDGTLGNGNVANYEFYVSTDGVNWGTAVSTGTLMTSGSDKTQKQVTFTGVVGRYVRFRAMSEVHGGPWTAVAELNVLGTQVATSGPQVGSLTLNPASIAGGGTTSTATVTLTSAPLTNATVTLASSNTAATVPATVTVNAGTTSANFTVTSASSVSTSALSVITATYNSSTGAALLAVTPGSTSIVSSIPQAGWLVQYVDSQATDCGNYGATNAIDGNPATMWITEWCHGSPTPPHEIQIDLGASYSIAGFQYLPRQDGGSNGNVANYEFYVSSNEVNWGTAVSTGTLMTSASDKTQKQVTFPGVVGRYVRFRAMSEVHGGPWTAVAELNVLGIPVATSPPEIASVTITPASITAGGTASTVTVALTNTPTSNATVTLASSNTNAATVPATVVVNAGTTTASFEATSVAFVSTNTVSQISASLNGSSGSAVLTVTPASLARIQQSGWHVVFVDSQATDCGNYGATNAFDGNPATMWLTEWCHGSPAPPHEIQIDLGASYTISGFQYLPRQDGSNGNVANYEFYVSADGANWGAAVASGTLIATPSDLTQKQVTFTGVVGRYVRFRAMSEVHGGPWTALAELNVLGTPVWSGILAPSRAINWSTAGVTGGIPNRTTVCATIDPYDGPADAINTAIANCPSGQVVLLSAGTFNLTSGIVFDNKSNVTLRGAGPDQTFLLFSAGGSCTGVGGADVCLITADTGDGGDQDYSNAATWTGGYSVGTTSITLGSATTGSIAALQVGSQIFLDQLDDASDPGTVYVCSAYGVCSTSGSSRNGRPGRGQVEPQLVTSISGTGPWTIGISPGIRMPNISAAKSPQAWWDNGLPIQNDGIENLTIDDTPDASCCTNGIFILNGRNNWIRNIRSVYAAQKHVWLYQTTHTTIRDSYFYGSVPTSDHYATDSFVGADNLTENNIFQHVAASMMNEGCIGCVGAYNYALDDYYTGTPVGTAPEWQQASSYQHSVGDAYILWEGNQGIGMTSDDVHGTSNFSTAFRNYWNGRDIAGGSDGGKTLQTNAVILNTFNRFYNIVGNVLGTAGYHDNYTSAAPGGTSCNTSIYALGWGDNCSSGAIADDTLVATTLMRWGNYDTVNNAIRFDNSEVPTALAEFANPVPATQALPGSLYLDARPSWFGSVPWPPIGPDVTGGDSPNVGGHAYKIPAQLCYENSARDANGMLTNFNADLCYAAASGPAARPPANGK